MEHYTTELFDHVRRNTPFDLLVPMKNDRPLRRQLLALDPEQFTRRWAGIRHDQAILPRCRMARKKPYFQFAQRTGETPREYRFGAFLSTTDRDEVETLTLDYPKRWHVEEFFNAASSLGLEPRGNIESQHPLRPDDDGLDRSGRAPPVAPSPGRAVFRLGRCSPGQVALGGLEGDVRVCDDTIIVTYYNAPDAGQLRQHYEGLPDRLQSEHIDPHIPWLYGFKLDFRFR